MADYFTTAELRAFPQMGDVTKFPETRVDDAAAYIIGIIEREVGTSFISRTVTAELHNGGTDRVVLDHADATAVTALSVDGTAVDVSTLVVQSGVVRQVSGGVAQVFASGIGNISVTYTYGYSTTPPGDVKEAAMRGTRAHLLASATGSDVNDRRTSITNEQGTVSFVVAGPDRPTGYPEVDAMIAGWRSRLNVVGFA